MEQMELSSSIISAITQPNYFIITRFTEGNGEVNQLDVHIPDQLLELRETYWHHHRIGP
jgi:hypothetical protein